MTRETRETFLVATGLILLFGVVKHASRVAPSLTELGFAAAMLFQLYVPYWLIRREGRRLADYNITSHGIFEANQKVDRNALWFDLKGVAALCLITFLPFWAAYHALHMYIASYTHQLVAFEFRLPANFFNLVLTSFLLVALPEELFYRGFIQTRLLRAWPNKKWVLGIPIGRAIIITSAFFALGHFIGDYNVARLAPFFPAFLFSYLVFRSQSIFGAVVFHALCNIFAQILSSSYFLN